MIHIIFTKTEQETLFEAYRNHTSKKTRIHAHALYLKSQNLPHGLICKVLRISPGTLINILKKYQTHGIISILHFDYAGQPSALNVYASTILEDFEHNPPATIAQARMRIYELTGILRSPTSIRDFSHRFGLKYLKTGSVPGGQKGNSEKKSKNVNNGKNKHWSLV